MKPVHWIGSSKKDLCGFPDDVKHVAGFSIHLAQQGGRATNAVSMVGFGSANVVELVIDDCGDTYRAVYTVKFRDAIYVLHAFQKKSKSGIATPQQEINLIKQRPKRATQHYQENYEQKQTKDRSHGKSA